MGTEVKGPAELGSEVEARKLCTLCGACVGMCPYRVAYRGRIVALDECSLPEGRCYAFCPRTEVDLDGVSQALFGTPYAGDEIGAHQQVVMARAASDSTRSGAQHGGTVSSLISFALRSGLIDSAVLTSSDDTLLPSGTVVHDEKGVLACAGSNFVASPTLAAFHEAAATDAQRIGVVATPCQVLALAKMKTSPITERNSIDKLKLVVGLFCTWSLRYEDFTQFLREKVELGEIKRAEIPPPPANLLEIDTDEIRVLVPLDEVRPYIRQNCEFCIDMTAELADVSVGLVEGVVGWNTLIVRSGTGKELVEAAVAEGVIETAPLAQANLDHLKEASLLKKKRALKKIVETTGSTEDLLYLKLSEEVVQRLLA